MSQSTSFRRKAVAASGLSLIALAGVAGPAAAGPRPPIVAVYGSGPYEVAADGSATMTGPGTILASPNVKVRDVPVTATVVAADGSLPPRGSCEAATATVVAGATRLAASGEVCGIIQATPLAMPLHVFAGRFSVVAGQRQILGAAGVAEVHLNSGGSAWASAITD